MYHLSLCDLPTPRDYSTILYWWLKILSPSSLYPLGNWASLSAYFIGTLNSAVQNWTHFLRTPGIYRIKPKFLGLASKTLPLSSAHSLTTAWAFFSMFRNILTSYRSWTHVFLYIVPWAEFMLLDSGTNLPLPINTLFAICPSVPSFDHMHPLIAVLTILYYTLYLAVLNLSSLKVGQGALCLILFLLSPIVQSLTQSKQSPNIWWTEFLGEKERKEGREKERQEERSLIWKVERKF